MFDPPKLRDDLPRYPPLLQLLRVTSATVPGPTGGTSTGPGVGNVPPPFLYVASTQQLKTDTLAPRDREPCLVVPAPPDMVLTAGYYLGRLAGSFNSLPVYEVTCCPAGSSFPQGTAGLPGLTPTQQAMINASLTPGEIADLNNLTACQLQVLLQLPVVNIQLLTTDLNPTQLQTTLDALTPTQLLNLVPAIPRSQVIVLSSAWPLLYQSINQFLTPAQALQLLANLNSQQMSTLVGLTPQQLQTVAQLTPVEQQALTGLTPAQVQNLVGQLPLVQLKPLLDSQTTSQLGQLGNALLPPVVLGGQAQFPLLPIVVGQPSSVPLLLTGYAPTVVDNTGKVWAYVGGTWANLSGSGGTSSSLNSPGTTTNSYATGLVWDITNTGGLHGGFSIKNTGLTNSLTWQITYTDMFGTATTSTGQILTPGSDGNGSFDLASIGAGGGSLTSEGNYPIKEAKLEVQDTIGGSHTTYSVWRSTVG